ncbi:DUF3052 family protein [uncultured Croceitalea sp.]|uniref:DUF3052 family protein n=1 Tax=uncultured Croceitalea sp. TaxID=1798908 RepID=UPI003305C949
MQRAGYSGTPLHKKLGIKEGFIVQALNAPKQYTDFFRDFPENVQLVDAQYRDAIDFAHVFCATKDELKTHVEVAKKYLKKTGVLWISWPKKSSKIPTEVDKFDIMSHGQEVGLVDTKVAAVDLDWSGHKFVYRTIDR